VSNKTSPVPENHMSRSNLNVALNSGTQHNIVASGGVILRF
jgi:hypothetical protein